MLTKAVIHNFKSLFDVEVAFESPLTVIVGPNGCGKSSVLKAIEFCISRINSGDVRMDPNTGTILDCLSKTNDAESISVHLYATKGDNQYRGTLEVSKPKAAPPPTSRIARRAMDLEVESISNILPMPASTILAYVLKFHPYNLGLVELNNRVPPSVTAEGKNLASTLAHIYLQDLEHFRNIEAKVRKIITHIEKLRFDRLPMGSSTADVLLIDFKGIRGVEAKHASLGTLMVLGIIAVIMGPSRPKLLLIDDLDYGLHPLAQVELVRLLQELIVEFPDLQIIATSHSAHILDKLKPEQIRVMTTGDDGGSVCAPLKDHPDFDKWSNSMTPGEFWSYEAEDWVKESVAKKRQAATAEVAV